MTIKDDLHHLVDDEPLSEDELARARADKAAIAAGDYVTLEELRRELEL